MISHTTAIFILGTLSAIFAVDTYLAWKNKHSTISETTTSYIQIHPVARELLALGIGILFGHLFFSVTYCG